MGRSKGPPWGPFPEEQRAQRAIGDRNQINLQKRKRNKQANQQTVKRAMAVAASAPRLSISITSVRRFDRALLAVLERRRPFWSCRRAQSARPALPSGPSRCVLACPVLLLADQTSWRDR